MNKVDIINLISQNHLKLTHDCVTDLLACSNLLEVDKATKLVSEGQYADKSYFIAKGNARAFYLKDGKDITDWFAFENDFINSINCYFLNIPSPHFIETIEPCILLEISKENAQILSNKYLEFDRLEKLIITKTLLQLQQRIVSMQFETAHQKYINLTKFRPDITQRVPLMYIASYLGITLETLSRIRSTRS
ncbi:MAG: Crp/Fnr family transcriptional regulator [Candidatus Methylacidiphilales bacterium]